MNKENRTNTKDSSLTQRERKYYSKKIKQFGFSEKNAIDKFLVEKDRAKEVKVTTTAIERCKSALLIGDKGTGKTFISLKLAIENRCKIEQVNLFELGSSLSRSEQIYKHLSFYNSLKYLFFNSKTIFMSVLFWNYIIFSIPTLIYGCWGLSTILSINQKIFPIICIVVSSFFAVIFFTLIVGWFRWKYVRNNTAKGLGEKLSQKHKIVIFTDNNLSRCESYEALHHMYDFFTAQKNTVLIFESSSIDKIFIENITKLGIQSVWVRSNYKLNHEMLDNVCKNDIFSCANVEKDIDDRRKFSNPETLKKGPVIMISPCNKSRAYNVKAIGEYNDFSISFFDYSFNDYLDNLCSNVSNRFLIEIKDKYVNKELNFFDYLIIQIASEKDRSFLESLMTKCRDLFKQGNDNNNYFRRERTLSGNDENSYEIVFDPNLEWWQKILVDRLFVCSSYIEIPDEKFEMEPDNSFKREKKLLSLSNWQEFCD